MISLPPGNLASLATFWAKVHNNLFCGPSSLATECTCSSPLQWAMAHSSMETIQADHTFSETVWWAESRKDPPPSDSLLKAVIFDLDGVVTRTAAAHVCAWKCLFDEFFSRWNVASAGEPKYYDPEVDYVAHIEGRPRIEAIRTYLGQHGITLPEGSLHQAPGYDTVGALANLKNQFFLNVIETYGVSLFDSTIELIHQLRARSIKVGLVTSSLNARMILNAAAIPDLFEVVVDGEVAASSGLAGKPAPDTFLAACQKLGVSPAQAIVVEDAVSGVKAASQGGFGLVVGLARGKNPAALIENGADVVFSDFAETDLPKLIRLIESKHAAQASVR